MNAFLEQIRSAEFWLRLAYTLLYALLWQLGELLLMLLTLAQILLRLFRGAPSKRLAGLGSSLSQFLWQTGRYLTAASDQKPWPFVEWPAADARWRRELSAEPSFDQDKEA